MRFIRRRRCEIGRGTSRAAAAAGLALALFSIAPLPGPVQAEDVTSAAEDAAVTRAADQAASQAASPLRRLTIPAWNGATLSGQMMPASS